ncbi:hypothetical protein ABW21_db0207795 [Orbilia brochopaga]|nr:hypothetical protein ABW21_db0207795 [Drechslerella brochopaga]
MADVSDPGSALAFTVGVEMEMTARPKKAEPSVEGTSQTAWAKLADAVAGTVRCMEIPVRVITEPDADGTDYSTWQIKGDGSIRPAQGYHGYEVVSPIMDASSTDFSWMVEIQKVWAAINPTVRILVNETCGFHVHIAPAPNWTLDGLKNLAKAIVFLDPIIDCVLPAHRVNSLWCVSNVSSPEAAKALRGMEVDPVKAFRQVFDEVDGLPDIDAVVQYISPSRLLSWNMLNIQRVGASGTVEFRRAPGVQGAEEALTWVEFVLAFVTAALSPEIFRHHISLEREVEGGLPSLESLKSFVLAGAGAFGLEATRITSLFTDCTSSPGVSGWLEKLPPVVDVERVSGGDAEDDEASRRSMFAELAHYEF